MKIVRVDPEARVLTEEQVDALLAEPHNVHLALIDESGWPVICPLWFIHEGDQLIASSATDGRKIRLARANPRGYFCVDVGTGAHDRPRGVRGRCDIRVVADDVDRAVDYMQKSLLKYMGTLDGDMQREFIESARRNETALLELTPRFYGAWGYA